MAILMGAIVLVIVVMCVVFLRDEGFWGAAIVWVNTFFSALLAINFFEPLAKALETQTGGFVASFTYFLDFLSLWIVFLASYWILRTVTGFLSRVRVRFRLPVEAAGKYLISALVGWEIACFAMMTLHTAPLPRNFLKGAFQPEQRMAFGQAPDRKWLGFMQKLSLGPLSRSTGEGGSVEPFDPDGEFLMKYAARREALEEESSFRVKSSD